MNNEASVKTTVLEVKEDGKIYVMKDCPEEHFSKGCHSELQCESDSLTFKEQFCGCYNRYQQALASCERILCADQGEAVNVLLRHGYIIKDGQSHHKPGLYQVRYFKNGKHDGVAEVRNTLNGTS